MYKINETNNIKFSNNLLFVLTTKKQITHLYHQSE